MRTVQLTLIPIVFLILNRTTPANAEKVENFLPGYIVLGADTITGFVLIGDHFSNIKECTFKETLQSPAKIYSADELSAYGIKGKRLFYSASIETDYATTRKVFLDGIVQSKVSLFVYRNRFFLNADDGVKELLEVKEQIQRNGKAVMVTRPLFKSVLQKQMEACTNIHEKLVDTNLTEKSLTALFKDYASCTGNNVVILDKQRPENDRTRYGFTLGVLAADLHLEPRTHLRYSFSEHASGNTSITFTPSFFMEFGISKRFDLCTGLTWYYTKNELHAKSTVTNLTHDFLLELSRIEIPILIKYTISNGNVKWSLKGGCGLNGIVKYENTLAISVTSSGNVLEEYTNDLNKNGLFLNGMGGVAAEFAIGNRSFLMEGMYSRSGSVVASGTHARLEALKFSVGMYF